MDQASGGTPAAHSGPSSANRDAAAEGVRVGHEDVMLSAFNRLHLYAPPGTTLDSASEQARAVTSNSRPRGVAATSPYTVPQSAVGRGRARTLPAWMTAGEHAPGGLRQQTPLSSDDRARVPQTTGLYSSRPQQSAQSAQQVGPNADKSFRLGVQTATKNKGKTKNQAAGVNTSNHVSRPTEETYSSPPQQGSTQVGQQAAPNKGDNIQIYSSSVNTKKIASPGGTYHAGGFHVFGSAQPRAASTLGPGSRTQEVKTEIARGLGPAPTPPTMDRLNCAPIGVPVAGPAVPATSQSVHPLSAGGRGLGRVLPAWMTSGAGPTVRGGLQQQAPVEGNLSAWVPGPAGVKVSPPQQSANAWQQASLSSSSDKHIQNNYSNEFTPTPAGVGIYHAGRLNMSESAQPRAAATLGLGNTARQVKTEIARGLDPTPTPPTADRTNCTPMEQVFVPAPAVPAMSPSMRPRSAGEQGLGKKLPAWTASGVGHTAVPGNLQQQAPVEGNLSAWAPEAAGLKPSPPHENASAGQQTPCNNGDKNVQNNKNKSKNTRAKTVSSATATSECNSRLTKDETIREGEPAPAPPTTTKSNLKPTEGVSVARGGIKYYELSKTADIEHTSQVSNQKRSRDEEPAVPLPMSVLGVQGAAREHNVASTVGVLGAVGRMASAESGPRSKKSKASVPDNSPPKSRVAVRSRFKIVHHHKVPNKAQVVDRGQRLPALTLGPQQGTNKNDQVSRGPSGRSSFSPQTLSTTNQKPASPLSVVIDGNCVELSYRGGDLWCAKAILLGIKFFEQHGVHSVTFVPYGHANSITPEDEDYEAYSEARATGAISSVPPGVKHRHFLLKFAMERKAFVMTNVGYGVSEKLLGFLEQTKEAFQAYVPHYCASFTFARDEFVPNPNAPLTKMLTQQASAERRGQLSPRMTGDSLNLLRLLPPPRPPSTPPPAT